MSRQTPEASSHQCGLGHQGRVPPRRGHPAGSCLVPPSGGAQNAQRQPPVDPVLGTRLPIPATVSSGESLDEDRRFAVSKVRVAAVQASYVLMDRDATLDRVAELTASAAN